MSKLNFNKRNIDKTKTEITLISDEFDIKTDITEYVNGINYEENQNVEFGYGLNNRPIQVGYGNINGSGTLTLTDTGVQVLNELKPDVDMMQLGKALDLKITVEYVDYQDSIMKDVLEGVQFTSFNRGVSSDTNLYNRDVNMMIGAINKNVN